MVGLDRVEIRLVEGVRNLRTEAEAVDHSLELADMGNLMVDMVIVPVGHIEG
jgi:hypothetical protein